MIIKHIQRLEIKQGGMEPSNIAKIENDNY